MKYAIALALAGIGLSPAIATHYGTVGNWDVYYQATTCAARTTINGTEFATQYSWATDTTVTALSNPNWTVPKDDIGAKLSMAHTSRVVSMDALLVPDVENNGVTFAFGKGTELLESYANTKSFTATLPNGTVVASFQFTDITKAMYLLAGCVHARRLADPFAKPALMMNRLAKGGIVK